MSKKTMTRRALFTSVISLILCCAMLMGTTFAWFTDNVTSGINKITAGNLDVELYHSDKAEQNEAVDDNTFLFDDVTLWEPGAVAYENFVVANKGDLALKYQMNLTFENATDNGKGGTLADVLKVAVVEGGFTGGRAEAHELWSRSDVDRYDLSTFTLAGALNSNENSNTYGVVVYWEPTDKDNDYNMNNEHTEVLTIDLGVHLYATQKEHEFDSFGPEYDKEATVFAAYTFESDADLLAFAPTAGDAASSGLSLTEDGKAQIDASGAWYPAEVDLATNGYILEYDLDITGLEVGQNVTVDTGETVSWGSTPIMLERGSTKVYYGLAKNEEIGTLEGTQLHISHEYTLDADNKLKIETVVSDGAESLTYSKSVASAAKTSLYWDIYTVTEASKATMDNFTFSVFKADVNNATELAAALKNGVGNSSAEIKLSSDIALTGDWTPIGNKAAGEYFTGTFDGNGHTISGLSVAEGDYVALIGAAKDAVIKNVTVAGSVSGENPAGIVARVEGSTVVENCVSNVDVSGSTKAGGIACNVTNTGDGEVKFINCVNNGDISGSGTAGLGGIIGYVNNDGIVTIENCINNGDVTGSGDQWAGAAIGYAAGTSQGSIIGFENSGTIAGKNSINDASGRYLAQGDTILAAYCATPANWTVSYTENGIVYYEDAGEKILVKVPADYEGTTVEIPDGVDRLSNGSFSNNSNIKTVNIPASVTDFGGTANSTGTGATGSAFKNSSVEEVVLTEGMTTIPDAAFNQATKLKSVNIPASVKNIGINAFAYTGLTELVVPATVENIGYGAFRGMANLTTVTIEGNVNIPIYAFRECAELHTVILEGDDVTFGAGSRGMIFTNKQNGDGSAITVYVANETVKDRLLAADTAANDYGGYKIVVGTVSSEVVDNAEELKEVLTGAGEAGAGNTVIKINADMNLTGQNWTPINVDGYHGADIVTIDGQNHTITGLNAPLFAGGFAGGSGIVIKNLTIADSQIVSASTQGSGAFIECVDSMDVITLENCHLKNSTLSGSRTGGLIGWTAGYNNQNDGPVKLIVTVKNCSVVNCELNASGSLGGIIGHSGGNAWTYTTISNCTVTGCELNSTDTGDWRVGVVAGTVNVGEQNNISNITESGNTLTQTGKTAPAGQSNLYGRFVPGTTGKLTIDGVAIN